VIAPDKLIVLLDSNAAASAGEMLHETPSSGMPQDGRYAVQLVGDDWMHYATGWTMPVGSWLGWLSFPDKTKQEWEFYQSGAQLNDVYTVSVLLFTREAFPNLRCYAVSPDKFLMVGLDMGYASANEFVWMEKLH
jgi:hypothetical protein